MAEIPSMNILDSYLKVINTLECPVCFEYAYTPINQCSAGHMLCNNCSSTVKNCPSCRVPMHKTFRARSLESVSEAILFPCRNNGCSKALPYKAMRDHENECTYPKTTEEGKFNALESSLLAHVAECILPFFVTKPNVVMVDKASQTIKEYGGGDRIKNNNSLPQNSMELILTEVINNQLPTESVSYKNRKLAELPNIREERTTPEVTISPKNTQKYVLKKSPGQIMEGEGISSEVIGAGSEQTCDNSDSEELFITAPNNLIADKKEVKLFNHPKITAISCNIFNSMHSDFTNAIGEVVLASRHPSYDDALREMSRSDTMFLMMLYALQDKNISMISILLDVDIKWKILSNALHYLIKKIEVEFSVPNTVVEEALMFAKILQESNILKLPSRLIDLLEKLLYEILKTSQLVKILQDDMGIKLEGAIGLNREVNNALVSMAFGRLLQKQRRRQQQEQ